MPVRYAVISFRRPALARSATVGTLLRHGVDPARVDVWLSDPGERSEYEAALAGTGVNVRDGAPGCTGNRVAALRSYPDGQRIVFVDDDIRAVKLKHGTALRELHRPLDELAEFGFAEAGTVGARMWGIYAAANAGFMRDTQTAGLRYIVGSFFGLTAPDPASIVPRESSGEDFANSIQSFLAYGAVLRIDWVTVASNYFAPGGIDQELAEAGSPDRQPEHARALMAIAARYPDLAKPYVKAGGVVNLRLKNLVTERRPRPPEWVPGD